MAKRLIALSLLIVLTAACDRAYVTPIPSATEISFTQPMSTTTPTALFNFAPTQTPVVVTPTVMVEATQTIPLESCLAPESRVKPGQQVTVTVEDWDKLKLRSDPKFAFENVVMELNQYTQLRILDGPICVLAANSNDDAYLFWKVAVIPSGEIGWVAEGDSTHYFIE